MTEALNRAKGKLYANGYQIRLSFSLVFGRQFFGASSAPMPFYRCLSF